LFEKRQAELSELFLMPVHQRSDILRRTAALLSEKSEEFANMLALEAGKPLDESTDLGPFDTEEEMIHLANSSNYGVQAGIFIKHINRAMRLADTLETGGVWIKEISAYRQDNDSYGGVIQNGNGKKG
jgi:acyl-CoA reductase-like NAD-dependent aldehyde dehydrogenase